MSWFFIALAAPLLWAIVNIADKFLVTNFSETEKERSSIGLVFFSSVIGFVIAFFIWIFNPNVFHIPDIDKILLVISGSLTVGWIILYLYTLEIEDVSSVAPWFLSIPLFGYILGYFILGENLTRNQFIGSLIIFFGLFFLSFDFNNKGKKFKHKPALYMLCASLIIAISGIIFKYVTIEGNFWVSSFWEYLGVGFTGFIAFTLIPNFRRSFLQMARSGGRIILFVNVGSELLTISGNLLTNFALLLAPVAMVFLVESFQPAMVLFLTILITNFSPHVIKENLSKKVLIKKVAAIIFMVIGSLILYK